MKNHVVSLELAKQLEENGYPQKDSLFKWSFDRESTPQWEIVCNQDRMWDEYQLLAAPLATELLEQLPVGIEPKDDKDEFVWNLTILKMPLIPKKPEEWFVSYSALGINKEYKYFQSVTLPDALAMMYLYLKKEELI